MDKGHLFLLWVLIPLSLSACLPETDVASTTSVQESALDTSLNLPFSLDQFEQIDEVTGLGQQYSGRLDTIIARRRLRVLVPYSQTTYYIDGVERKGLAYEAMIQFERYLNQHLGKSIQPPHIQMVFIPLTRDQLIPSLLAGYGDLIAANLTITPSRSAELLFTEPIYSGAREILVTGTQTPPLDTLADLAGRALHVRTGSSFFEHVLEWNNIFAIQGLDTIQIVELEEKLEDETVLELIDAQLIPMTIMEENKARFWSQALDSVQLHPAVAIDEDGEIAWAVQPESYALKEVLDGFIEDNRKGTLMGNILFNRYLKNEQRLQGLLEQKGLDRFYQLQEHFMHFGAEYQLPWMMLAALAYQESHFNQSLRSRAGAVGIMQVLPTTARDPIINIPNIHQEKENIHAGTKFLRFVIDQYFTSTEIDSLNAGLFGLAAYNAGPHRIRQLQKMAAAQGLNPNVWFNNVELMAAREIGRETVQYVSNIYKYYSSYRYLYLYTARTGRLPWEEERQ